MSESAFRIFLRGSAVSLAGAGLLGVLNYFVRRTLSVSLSVADYGAFYSMFSLFAMYYAFSDLGMFQSATTLIAKYSGTEKQHIYFKAFMFFRLGVSTLLTFVAVCGADFIRHHYLSGVPLFAVVMLCLLFFLQSAEGCFRSLYNGLKEFATQQVFALLYGVLLLAGVLLAGVSLNAVCAVFASAALLSFAANIVFCRIRQKIQLHGQVRKEVWKELFSLGGCLAVATALFSSLYHLDTVMLTFLKGEKSAALYNIALPITQIVQMAMVLPSVMLPVAMDMSRKQDMKGLKKFAVFAFLISLFAALLCYCFFAWSGRWLVIFLFSEKYVEAAAVVPVLCSAFVFYIAGHFLLQILISLESYNAVVLIAAVCFGSNCIFNYFLIGAYDFKGAGMATLLSYFVFALAAFICLSKKLFEKRIVQEQKNVV